MKGLDLIAMPSEWEACGVLSMEALVAGVPLVGSNCIGLREVLAGTPARMVEPSDVQALAKTLLSEISDKRRSCFEEFAFEAAERFTVTETGERIRSLYDQLF